MSLQILLQQQREEASKDFNIWFKEYPGTPTIGEVEEWFISRYSTIQNQIVEAASEKCEGMTADLSNMTEKESEFYGIGFDKALSDLSSWLTEEMDKK